MSNLLRAGFVRLFRDKFFFICTAAMFALGVYIALDQYMASKQTDWYHPIPDNIVFLFLGYGGLVYAAFCALFIGREYSDGTLRNKLMIGHTRDSIYVSNLIVTAVGNIIITLAYILPAAIISTSVFGWFQRPTSFIFITFIALLILAVAYAAVFTILSLLNSNKAVNAVVCIALAIVLLVAAIAMRDMLYSPESYSTGYIMEMDENGVIHETVAPEEPNPYYISGFKRQIVEVLVDLSPGGQSLQLPMFENDSPEILALYSVGLTAAVTAIGIVLFRRKDIK